MLSVMKKQAWHLAKEIQLPIVDLGGSILSVIGSTTATETVWHGKHGT